MISDLELGLRQLAKTPSFTIADVFVCCLTVWRATRVNPMEALRAE